MSTRPYKSNNAQNLELKIGTGLISTQPFLQTTSYVSEDSEPLTNLGMLVAIDANADGYNVDPDTGAVVGQVMDFKATPTDDGSGNISWEYNGQLAGITYGTSLPNGAVQRLLKGVYITDFLVLDGVSTDENIAKFKVKDLLDVPSFKGEIMSSDVASGQSVVDFIISAKEVV